MAMVSEWAFLAKAGLGGMLVGSFSLTRGPLGRRVRHAMVNSQGAESGD